jgi:hypothetical protein
MLLFPGVASAFVLRHRHIPSKDAKAVQGLPISIPLLSSSSDPVSMSQQTPIRRVEETPRLLNFSAGESTLMPHKLCTGY